MPVRRALELGMVVSVHSDDPAYFGGYILDNYLAVMEAQNLSKDDIVRLAENSIISSFLDQASKERLINELKATATVR